MHLLLVTQNPLMTIMDVISPEKSALLVQSDHKDQPGLVVRKARLDHKALRENLALMALAELPVRRDPWVHKVLRGIKGILVLLALLDQ
jgi:hypothetical protein